MTTQSRLKIGDPWPFASSRGLIGEPLDQPVWHALQVPPQRERAAREALRALGIHACYPERLTSWRVRGKHYKRAVPVVARIVYAKFTHRPNWDVFRARRIITGVVSWGSVPIAIPKDTIAAVMGLPTEAEKLEQARRELLMVREAEQAVITDGPLSGAIVDVRQIRGGIAWFNTLAGIKGTAPVSALARHVAPTD